MRQRLGLAAALLRQPELLVLDEPTNGLDPQGIREVRELLEVLHARGTTIFLSSHLLAEVEQLCTRIGVLDLGRLVLQEQLETLQAPTGRTVCAPPTPPPSSRCSTAASRRATVDRLVIRATDTADLNALVATGIGARARPRRSLEEVVHERTARRGGPGRADRAHRRDRGDRG